MFVVVHTVRHLVEGGAGHRADLACVVHAEPTAEVVWYKNSMRLDLNRGYISRQEGRKHHLTIPSVGEEDFANYTCEATNSLGKSRAAIQLRGNPRPPVYNSKVSQCWSEAGEDSRSVLQVEFVSSHCYRVSWATLSYQEILQYRVQWRKAGVSRDTTSQSSHSSYFRPTAPSSHLTGSATSSRGRWWEVNSQSGPAGTFRGCRRGRDTRQECRLKTGEK